MPDSDPHQSDLTAFLEQFVTDERKERIRHVLESRTRYITVVLEDIYQPHNGSAVLRSCDALGIQDIHTIENYNPLDISSGVTKNAHRWLTLHRYREEGEQNTKRCYQQLRESGYSIAATSPHEVKKTISLNDLPLNQKTAIVFGAEKFGLSEYAKNDADYNLQIPMYGFSESYNISVSAALCLYQAVHKMREELESGAWQLSEKERTELHSAWIRKSVKNVSRIEANYLRGLQGDKESS